MKRASLQDMKERLIRLEEKIVAETVKRKHLKEHIHPKQLLAAQNLIQYLTLRNEDIRELQDQLHIAGLSSLTSSESHIHRQLQSILKRLGTEYPEEQLNKCSYDFSCRQISQKSRQLFGDKKDISIPYIMVTFDSSFAGNYAFIKTLLQNGMNVARINCAHDDEAVWSQMIQLLKRACRHTGIDCKIYMDLAGPKMRTRLTGKGKKKGRAKVKEGELVWLAEEERDFDEDLVVIDPQEKGIVAQLKKGERVFMDDGVIKGVIEKVRPGAVALRIVRNASDKQQIRTDKGINFPDSKIIMSPLSEFDTTCLPFICEHADMVGYSFVRTASELKHLQQVLHGITTAPLSIIIKIETPEAVNCLPDLLLQGMEREAFGVMIARGDLAVEIGFERMGEIQEEILWICESAHVPVIWATQVLESLNKSGVATRSEITDAAHAALAECVMVNKGKHTVEVIETLRDICSRMGGHHVKKRYTFRPLGIAQKFIQSNSV